MTTRTKVRFGDIVCLAVPDLGGVVHSDDHITSSAYVDRRKVFHASAIGHDQHRTRFTLTPKLSYTMTKRANKHSKEHSRGHTGVSEEARRLKQLLSEERSLNSREAQRSSGEVIHYGSIVQIQDTSGKFLTQVKNSSKRDATALMITLSPDGNEGSWWRVIPAEAVRSDGEPVRYADKIWLQSAKFRNCYFSVCASQPILDRDVPSETEIDLVRMHAQCSQRFETFAAPRPRKLQIFPVRRAVDAKAPEIERHLVCGFNVVTFHRRQCGSFLGAGGTARAVQWLGRGEQQERWPDCLWRVVKLALEDGGETVRSSVDCVGLQHLTTGWYLEVDAFTGRGLGLTEDFGSKRCAWTLVTEAGEDTNSERSGLIFSADYIWLRSGEPGAAGAGLWVSSEVESTPEDEVAGRGEAFPKGLGVEERSWHCPQLKASMQDGDAIEVQQVAVEQAAEVEKLVDSRHLLSRLRSQLEKSEPLPTEAGDEERARLFKASGAAAVLDRLHPWVDPCLCYLVNACTVSEESDSLKRAGPPVPAHQDLLRQVGVISEVEALILVVFEHLHVPLMQVKKALPRLLRLLRLAYKLLEKASAQHSANKLALLPFFPHMRAHKFGEIGSFFAWAEIFKNTPEVLNAVTDAELAEYFELVSKRQSERIITVVIQCCHVKETPIRRNQDRIAEWLLSNLDAVPIVSTSHSDVHFSFPNIPSVGTISVTDIFQQGDDAVFKPDLFQCSKPVQAFRFAIKMLELFGWLVLGRNEKVRARVLAQAERLGVSLRQLQTVVVCAQLPWCLRAVCCDLLRRLYVDAPPLAPVQMLLQTRVLRLESTPPAQQQSSPNGEIVMETTELELFTPPGQAFTGVSEAFGSGGGSNHQISADVLRVVRSESSGPADDGQTAYVGRGRSARNARRKSLDNALRATMERLLENWTHLDFDNIKKNVFMLATVKLLMAMTEQGLYHVWSQEQQDLVPDLSLMQKAACSSMAILCGRNRPCAALKGRPLHRFAKCPENEVIVEIKSSLLDLNRCYGLICDNARVTHAVTLFRNAVWRARRVGGPGAPQDWEKAPPWTAEELQSLREGLFAADEELFTALVVQRDWLERMFEHPPAAKWRSIGKKAETVVNLPEVLKILLDLTRYEYPAMQERALLRIVHFFSQGSRFVELLGRVQLLSEPQSLIAHGTVREDVRDIGEILRQVHRNDKECGTGAELQLIKTRMRAWKGLCCAGSAGTKEEVCKMVHRLGGTEVLLDIVSREPERVAGERDGCLDRARNAEHRELLQEVCGLLAGMCRHEREVQDAMVAHAAVLWALVGIEGLDVEVLLQAVLDGHPEVATRHGEAWIRKLFAAMARFHRCRSAKWMLLLESLLTCRTQYFKEHQCLVVLLLTEYQRTVLAPAGEPLALSGDDGHNERVRLSAAVAEKGRELRSEGGLAFQLAVVRVLSACTRGKVPTTEAVAANTLSFRDCVRAIAWCNTLTDGTRLSILPVVQWNIKAAYLRFLHDVYNECSVQRLHQEFEEGEESLWSLQPANGISASHFPSPGAGDSLVPRPLMHELLSDMQTCAAQLQKRSSAREDSERALFVYVRDAVIPMVSYYLMERSDSAAAKSYSAEKQRIIEEMIELATKIARDDQPEYNTADDVPPSRWRGWSSRALLAVLSTIGQQAPSMRCGHAVAGTDEAGPSEWHKQGWKAFCLAVEREFGELDARSREVESGMRYFGMLMARDEPLPVYDYLEHLIPDHTNPPDPQAALVLMSLLDTCMNSATGAPALAHLLCVVRTAIYLHDPARPGRVPSECNAEWDAMLSGEPVRKSEPAGAMLAWVQDKFDRLGCTRAAFSLAAHTSREVRRRAVLLLLALLQDRSRRVQGTIVRCIEEGHGDAFFRAVQEELKQTEDKVRNLKRSVKNSKPEGIDGFEPTPSRETHQESAMDEEEVGKGSEFGRMSLVMLQLRLVQFMCEGQNEHLQNATVRQTRTGGGYNLVKSCVELLRALQPWVPDALALGRFDVALLCVQITDTLSEILQGPNEATRRVVLSTPYLLTANSFLEMLFYDRSDEHQGERARGVGVNEIKCWLKQSTLACCLTLFESVSPQLRPQSWVAHFSIDYLGRQIAEIASLLDERTLQAKQPEPSDPQPYADGDYSMARSLSDPSLSFISRKRSGESFSARIGLRARRGKSLESVFGADGREQLENELFQLYRLLLCMREVDGTGAVARLLVEEARMAPRLYAELDSQCKHVELVRTRGGRPEVEKVFFRVDQQLLASSMSPDLKSRAENIFLSVPRNNPQEKSKAFLHQTKQVLLLLRWFTFCQANSWACLLIKHRHRIDAAPFLTAVVVTLWLLAIYGIPVDPNTGGILGDGRFWPGPDDEDGCTVDCDPYKFANLTSDPRTVGASIGGVVGESDLALRYRLSLTSRWERTEEWEFFPVGRWIAMALACGQVAATLLNAACYVGLDLPIRIVMAIEAEAQRQSTGGESVDVEGDVKTVKEYLDALPALPTQREVQLDFGVVLVLLKCCFPALYFAFLTCLSVLGAVSSPLLHVFLILDYFRQKDGQLVLQAIVVGGPNLLRSMVLGILVMICFGFYTYAYFSSTVMEYHDLCHSPFQCVSKHILDTVTGDLSTVLGDDFGGFSAPPMVAWQDVWDSWRSVFVFFSIVFWVFLLQGIIQGQIIDAFAEMRSATTSQSEDLENFCFVSSIERYKFAPFPGEWENRRKAKYAWHFIWYFAYLHQKDPQEYTGIENQVAGQYEQEDISFLPVGVYKGPNGRGINEMFADDSEMKLVRERLQAMEDQYTGLSSRLKGIADQQSWIIDHLRVRDGVGAEQHPGVL